MSYPLLATNTAKQTANMREYADKFAEGVICMCLDMGYMMDEDGEVIAQDGDLLHYPRRVSDFVEVRDTVAHDMRPTVAKFWPLLHALDPFTLGEHAQLRLWGGEDLHMRHYAPAGYSELEDFNGWFDPVNLSFFLDEDDETLRVEFA